MPKNISIKDVKKFRSKFLRNNKNTASNKLTTPEIKIKNKKLIISTSDVEIEIQKIKVENGKEMSSKEFINGFLQKHVKIIFTDT